MSDTVTTIQPHEQVLLITVEKRALDEVTVSRLEDEVLTAAAERPGVPLVLDLARVRFAPSVALGSLVRLTRSLKIERRRIALIHIARQILDTIRVTQLHQVLEIHDNLEQVLTTRPSE